MPLKPNARLGPYEVLAPIGAGGMGEVYRARDSKLRREVAIKVLPSAFARDAERVARFEREARALAALNHPNIAAIYGLEDADGATALVMELVEGSTLAERIAQGPIPFDEMIPIARQIADALEAAHGAGIIHRDLKPANVKVRGDGVVKVLDFGLAKAIDAARPGSPDPGESPTTVPAMTHAGMILGTAPYMSPEQARGKSVDKRTDIWAFGCVVYEMLSGKRPFQGETAMDVLAAVVKKEPDWRALPADTPGSVNALLRRCLQKDPSKRLRDIGDAGLQIQDAIVEADVPSPAAPARRRAARWTVVVPWAVATALAIATAWLVVRAPGGASPAGWATRLELILPPGVEPYVGIQAVAFSPDGSRVAFIGSVAGYKQVYVRDLDTFDAVPIRGTGNVNAVFFSPDGRSIGILLGDRVLGKVSLEDGLVVPLVRGAQSTSGGAWGKDNRITFVRENVLWQVAASGGAPTQLTKLDTSKGELRHAFPATVAGSQAILFAVRTGTSREAVHIEAVSLTTRNRNPVGMSGTTPLYGASGHLIVSRDRALVAAPFDAEDLRVTGPEVKVVDQLRMSSIGTPMAAVSDAGSLAYMSGAGVNQLVLVSRQGVEQRITPADREYAFARLKPTDGLSVLTAAGGDLWIGQAASGALAKMNTAGTTGNSYHVWTPDGKRVVFRTTVGLYVMDVEGGQPQSIPDTSDLDYPTSVSPDGKTLIFVRTTESTSGDIYALSLYGDPKPHAIVSTSAYEGGGQVSPDGLWLAYTSDGAGQEQTQVFVGPFSGRGRTFPLPQTGKYPRWTRGGKELVYRDGKAMMAVDVSIGNGEPSFSSPRPLFEDQYSYGIGTSVANYDVTPDGQRFVMVKGEPGSNRLNLVLNWFAELKRLAPTGR